MKCSSSSSLDRVKEILKAFLDEIEKNKEVRKGFSQPSPSMDFGSASFWEKEDAYSWIFVEPQHCRALMHRPQPRPMPEYYREQASPLYEMWLAEEKEIFGRGVIIPAPNKGVAIADYLQQLALLASEENEHRAVWIKSLRSFIQFLKEDTHRDQQGTLETIFPSQNTCLGMEFRKGYSIELEGDQVKQVERRYILRRIKDEVYPIDVLAAGEILWNLADTLLKGRPNAQRSAAEALGFAWLCLATGSYRLVTREEFVFDAPVGAIKLKDPSKPRDYFHPEHFIGIDSFDGIVDVPVSKVLCEYLLALPREPDANSIFSMPWESLCRTLQNKGIKPSIRSKELGAISFLTFMSFPHEAIGHRPGPKLLPGEQ